MCAGLIGYRSFRFVGDARRIGLYGSGRRPTSSRRWRWQRDARSTRSRRQATLAAQAFARSRRRGVGRRVHRSAARLAGRGDHLRAGWSLVPKRCPGRPWRRRRLRRHPHERHPGVSLPPPLGGAGRPLGREPHATGRTSSFEVAARVPIRTQTQTYALEDANKALADSRGPRRGRGGAGAMTAGRTRRERLEALGITFEPYQHPPIATAEEGDVHWSGIDAVHCKNLFLRNQKGTRHYLVISRTRNARISGLWPIRLAMAS